MLMCGRSQHSIVKQLSSDKNFFKEVYTFDIAVLLLGKNGTCFQRYIYAVSNWNIVCNDEKLRRLLIRDLVYKIHYNRTLHGHENDNDAIYLCEKIFTIKC